MYSANYTDPRARARALQRFNNWTLSSPLLLDQQSEPVWTSNNTDPSCFSWCVQFRIELCPSVHHSEVIVCQIAT